MDRDISSDSSDTFTTSKNVSKEHNAIQLENTGNKYSGSNGNDYIENNSKKDVCSDSQDSREQHTSDSNGGCELSKTVIKTVPKCRYWTMCSAIGCTHKVYGKTCSFILFPKDPGWREKWIIALQRCHVDMVTGKFDRHRLWDPPVHMKLCTCHFSVPFNAKTRKYGYNHIIPDILTFPPEEELKDEQELWQKQRVIMKDEWLAKLGPQLNQVTDITSSVNNMSPSYSGIDVTIATDTNKEDPVTQSQGQNMLVSIENENNTLCLDNTTAKNYTLVKGSRDSGKLYSLLTGTPDSDGYTQDNSVLNTHHHLNRIRSPDDSSIRIRSPDHSPIIHQTIDQIYSSNTDSLSKNNSPFCSENMTGQPDLNDQIKIESPYSFEDRTHSPNTYDTPLKSDHLNTNQLSTVVMSPSIVHQSYSSSTLVIPDHVSQNNTPTHAHPDNISADEIAIKYPLFVKYHNSSKDVRCRVKELDTADKQYINHCSAINCSHRVSQKICSFLSFPKSPEWRLKWVKAMRRCYVDEKGQEDSDQLWEPRDYHRLCTCHFSTPINAKARKIGYNHIMPDIFSFPDDYSLNPSYISYITEQPTLTKPKLHVIQPENLDNVAGLDYKAGLDNVAGLDYRAGLDNGAGLDNAAGLDNGARLDNGFRLEENCEGEGKIQLEQMELHSATESPLIGVVNTGQQKNTVNCPLSTEPSTHDTKLDIQEPPAPANKVLWEEVKKKDGEAGWNVCSVTSCTHRRSENYCSFVSFPKIKDLAKKWVTSIGMFEPDSDGKLKPWKPDEQNKICVCHFSTPINARSRSPGMKLIVPDIIDTNSFIPVPMSKSVAGDSKIVTLKRVDASHVRLYDVKQWTPAEMDMFLVKNFLPRMGSSNDLVERAWSYVLSKREAFLTGDHTDLGEPPKKKLKVNKKEKSGVSEILNLLNRRNPEITDTQSNINTTQVISDIVKNVINNVKKQNAEKMLLKSRVETISAIDAKEKQFSNGIIRRLGNEDKISSHSSLKTLLTAKHISDTGRSSAINTRVKHTKNGNSKTRIKRKQSEQYPKIKGQYPEIKEQYAEIKGQYPEIKEQYSEIKGQYPEIKEQYSVIKEKLCKIEGNHSKINGSHTKIKRDYFQIREKLTDINRKHCNVNKDRINVSSGHCLLKSVLSEPSQRDININSHHETNVKYVYQINHLDNDQMYADGKYSSDEKSNYVTVNPELVEEDSIIELGIVNDSDNNIPMVPPYEEAEVESDDFMCRECGDTFTTKLELSSHEC